MADSSTNNTVEGIGINPPRSQQNGGEKYSIINMHNKVKTHHENCNVLK